MKKEETNGWVNYGETAVGILLLAGVWLVGLATGWFIVHVVYPLGFWLTFDGLAGLVGERQLIRRPATFASMTLLGAAMGLILDFYMVFLTRILDLTAVTDPGIALQMYLGWGFCLPAAYQSYRVVFRLLGDAGRLPRGIRFKSPALPFFQVLPFPAFPLAVLPLFSQLWAGGGYGNLILSSFLGFWLLAEYVQLRRGRSSLARTTLGGDLRPLLAMALASLPFTVLWEALNALMGSWRYQNLFWLRPEILGVPLVAYFGYFCGYYVIFLSVYGAIRSGDEDALPLYAGER